MGITITHGDLLKQKDVDAIVNTVNCVGVMGKGIALEYKKRYPIMFKRYKVLCDLKLIKPSMLWLYKDETKWILNFPTKDHWRNPSKIEYLESGLTKFLETYKLKGITSISFPLLGATNGGIDPNVSLQIIKALLEACKKDLNLFSKNVDKIIEALLSTNDIDLIARVALVVC